MFPISQDIGRYLFEPGTPGEKGRWFLVGLMRRQKDFELNLPSSKILSTTCDLSFQLLATFGLARSPAKDAAARKLGQLNARIRAKERGGG